MGICVEMVKELSILMVLGIKLIIKNGVEIVNQYDPNDIQGNIK